MVSSGRGRRAPPAGALHIFGPRAYQRDILVLVRIVGTSRTGRSAIGKALEGAAMKQTPTLPVLLESYFTQRLMAQQQASPHTIASYRDTFRLLLHFAKNRCGKSPSDL